MSRLISSVAGLGAGCDADSGTRSSLVFQVLRILKECPIKPQVLICENVPQLCSTENMPNFIKILDMLEDLDYQSKWYLINAKTMGIPQNRNRIFITSVPKGYTTSEPRRMPLEIRLKHLLDKNVDEKYYLSESMINYISYTGKGGYNNQDSKINKEIARPLTTDQNKRAGTTNYLGDGLPLEFDLSAGGGTSPTISTKGKDDARSKNM